MSDSTSTNFGAPLYTDADTASFSAQLNGVTEVFDAKATLNTDSRLSDERVPEDASVTTAKIVPGAVTPACLSDSNAVHQPGDLIWSMARTRAGAIAADGTAYTLSAHAELAALASACPDWVSGGVLTMPDIKGRVLMGSGSGAGLSPRSLGQKGGVETVQLVASELPFRAYQTTTGFGIVEVTNTPGLYLQPVAPAGSVGVGATTVPLVNPGGDQAHPNTQPYLVLNAFFKI